MILTGKENSCMMNVLCRENNQFDIGLILHKKMTHPIITNYQFYHNRIFDPTFLISIILFGNRTKIFCIYVISIFLKQIGLIINGLVEFYNLSFKDILTVRLDIELKSSGDCLEFNIFVKSVYKA